MGSRNGFTNHGPSFFSSRLCVSAIRGCTTVRLPLLVHPHLPNTHTFTCLAISGIGGSGQLDPTVAANATVAILAATAVAALTVVPTLFDFLGPRGCLLISGWTYPLFAGSLLCYNRTSFILPSFLTLYPLHLTSFVRSPDTKSSPFVITS